MCRSHAQVEVMNGLLWLSEWVFACAVPPLAEDACFPSILGVCDALLLVVALSLLKPMRACASCVCGDRLKRGTA